MLVNPCQKLLFCFVRVKLALFWFCLWFICCYCRDTVAKTNVTKGDIKLYRRAKKNPWFPVYWKEEFSENLHSGKSFPKAPALSDLRIRPKSPSCMDIVLKNTHLTIRATETSNLQQQLRLVILLGNNFLLLSWSHTSFYFSAGTPSGTKTLIC